MKIKFIKNIKLFFNSSIFILILNSCTSDITFNTETFDSLLVVNATLTDELKQQEILLSRTFPFGDESTNETGAEVKIIGNDIEISFSETEDGLYKSNSVFQAIPNVAYHLSITTSDGNVYSSAPKTLTSQSQIESITVNRFINDDGVDGMGLFVNSFDPTNSSQYYRYEYEETFKVIAPMWQNMDAVVVSDIYPNCEVGLVPRSEDEKVCYRTEVSNQLNITTTTTLNEDRVDEHLVRFLSNQDYKISHRYSLLLKQLVISETGYNYLERLNNFVSEGSLFSQVQTGFLVGNIKNDTNPNEKVIGFFEVASVDTQRVFFNYRDYYPTEDLPPYITEYYIIAPPITINNMVCGGLINIIANNNVVYLRDYDGNPPFDAPGPYYMIPRGLGDCTALGTNVIPDFWVE